MPGNKSEAQCCMASRVEWHQPVKEEADWLRLFLFENETAPRIYSTNLVQCFHLSPTTLGSARPQY